MFFFPKGDVRTESAYGRPRRPRSDVRKSARTQSTKHSLIVCKFLLILLDGLASLGRIFACVSGKAAWRVDVLLIPL